MKKVPAKHPDELEHEFFARTVACECGAREWKVYQPNLKVLHGAARREAENSRVIECRKCEAQYDVKLHTVQ